MDQALADRVARLAVQATSSVPDNPAVPDDEDDGGWIDWNASTPSLPSHYSDESDDGRNLDDADLEEMEVMEVTEAEMLAYLDADCPPLIVCRSLFKTEETTTTTATSTITTTTSATYVLDSSSSMLGPGDWSHLYHHGYVVCDDLPGASQAAQALLDLAEIKCDDLRPPGEVVSVLDTSTTDLAARGDLIMFLDDPGDDTTKSNNHDDPLVFMERVRVHLGTRLSLQRGVTERQLARYAGKGERYERHRDALPDGGLEEGHRRVTVILYANDRDWDMEKDGGALRIYLASVEGEDVTGASPPGVARPSTGVDMGERYVDIAPTQGRVVIFLSGAMDHAVQPTFRPRVALTAWMQ
jgi:hypothetical protein